MSEPKVLQQWWILEPLYLSHQVWLGIHLLIQQALTDLLPCERHLVRARDPEIASMHIFYSQDQYHLEDRQWILWLCCSTRWSWITYGVKWEESVVGPTSSQGSQRTQEKVMLSLTLKVDKNWGVVPGRGSFMCKARRNEGKWWTEEITCMWCNQNDVNCLRMKGRQ